jgi:hypothetical protein
MIRSRGRKSGTPHAYHAFVAVLWRRAPVNESGRVRWLPEGTGPRAAAPHICARKWRPPCLLYCVGQTQTEEEGREGGGGGAAKQKQGACGAPGRRAGPRGPATATTAFAGRGAGGRQRPWSGGGGPAQQRTAAGARGAWSIESPAPDGTRPRGGGGLRASPASCAPAATTSAACSSLVAASASPATTPHRRRALRGWLGAEHSSSSPLT